MLKKEAKYCDEAKLFSLLEETWFFWKPENNETNFFHWNLKHSLIHEKVFFIFPMTPNDYDKLENWMINKWFEGF